MCVLLLLVSLFSLCCFVFGQNTTVTTGTSVGTTTGTQSVTTTLVTNSTTSTEETDSSSTAGVTGNGTVTDGGNSTTTGGAMTDTVTLGSDGEEWWRKTTEILDIDTYATALWVHGLPRTGVDGRIAPDSPLKQGPYFSGLLSIVIFAGSFAMVSQFLGIGFCLFRYCCNGCGGAEPRPGGYAKGARLVPKLILFVGALFMIVGAALAIVGNAQLGNVMADFGDDMQARAEAETTRCLALDGELLRLDQKSVPWTCTPPQPGCAPCPRAPAPCAETLCPGMMGDGAYGTCERTRNPRWACDDVCFLSRYPADCTAITTGAQSAYSYLGSLHTGRVALLGTVVACVLLTSFLGLFGALCNHSVMASSSGSCAFASMFFAWLNVAVYFTMLTAFSDICVLSATENPLLAMSEDVLLGNQTTVQEASKAFAVGDLLSGISASVGDQMVQLVEIMRDDSLRKQYVSGAMGTAEEQAAVTADQPAFESLIRGLREVTAALWSPRLLSNWQQQSCDQAVGGALFVTIGAFIIILLAFPVAVAAFMGEKRWAPDGRAEDVSGVTTTLVIKDADNDIVMQEI